MSGQKAVAVLVILGSGLSAVAQSGGGMYQDYLLGEGREAGAFASWDPAGQLDQGGAGAAPALPVGGQPAPNWFDTVLPGDWCGTNQRYLAELAALGMDPSRAICPPVGPCDDPIVRDAFIPDGGGEVKTVRLSIHVFCESDGSNCAAGPADVAVAVARLNTDFAPWGYQFQAVSEYINSSRYRDVTDGDDGMMKHRYADSPETTLNIYVVETGGVCWGTFPWSEYAQTFYGGVVMDDTWFGASSLLPHILTHEVGHCLGLWHTFHGVDEVPQCGDCYEPAGRSPELGDITGDLCSDTEPTLRSARACSDPAGLDPCSGNPWLGTPFLNYMSYSNSCAVEFTDQQGQRMHCWTEAALSGWLVPEPPPNTPGTPVLTGQGGGAVLVAWADNSGNEDGFQVERARKSGKRWVDVQIVADVGPDVTSLTDAPGSGTFRYRVLAYNENGDSAWSAWAQISN